MVLAPCHQWVAIFAGFSAEMALEWIVEARWEHMNELIQKQKHNHKDKTMRLQMLAKQELLQ